ncbi:MAG TPA: amidohydrolase family protein [Pseudolabrys sp.]|jgi:predicted TIM-barrel fold metal-dependent hydrolase
MKYSLRASCTCCSAPNLGRRQFLSGATAAACSLALAGLTTPALAQAKPRIIDVHSHVVAPEWKVASKILNKDSPLLNNWTIQKTLDDMEKGGVETAITSSPAPQTFGLDQAAAAKLARECNDYAKRLESDYKGRFGTWATLPFPYVDACLKEIEYAFDTLKVDGIGCLTSYGDKWLGDVAFEPIWQELNRRKATVNTHPTTPSCCTNPVPAIDDVYIEYGTDTARAIFTVIFSGFGAKFSDINWIWSHGGGVITSVYERFTVQVLQRPVYRDKFTRQQIEAQIRRFYYDTAAIPNDVTMSALAKMVPASQILFGTDFPYRRADEYVKYLPTFFKDGDVAAIERDNALRLLPRLKA